MPEQVPLSVLHPQVAQMNPNREKRHRRLTRGPPFNWQPFYENKPTSIENFLD
jgi:hypothetical protein